MSMTSTEFTRVRRQPLLVDPPVRPDGKCARPGCGKKRRAQISSYARASDFERDPFCSRTCCEQFHNLSASGKPLDEE
jgi:hypothetical protein